MGSLARGRPAETASRGKKDAATWRVLEHRPRPALADRTCQTGQGRATSRGAGILAQQEQPFMQDIRCGACHRKLGAGEYLRLAIKCPRCGTMNILRAERPTPESRRASYSGDPTHEHERPRPRAAQSPAP
ncbi:Com family DNA-binding transcriptional regulator [Ralstonia pseudosolanacearum]